ncbi:hypothetical protein GQ457_14G013950 [Hibiscus cannabinus]
MTKIPLREKRNYERTLCLHLFKQAETREPSLRTNLLRKRRSLFRVRRWKMATKVVDAAGEPIPTSSVLMSAAKHIEIKCMSENVEFLKCKKKDPNPEKCLDKGRQATRCALGVLKDLYGRCKDPMEAYVGCMYYHTNEFDLCRKEQQDFEKACPFD